jgi:hypothetical protein
MVAMAASPTVVVGMGEHSIAHFALGNAPTFHNRSSFFSALRDVRSFAILFCDQQHPRSSSISFLLSPIFMDSRETCIQPDKKNLASRALATVRFSRRGSSSSPRRLPPPPPPASSCKMLHVLLAQFRWVADMIALHSRFVDLWVTQIGVSIPSPRSSEASLRAHSPSHFALGVHGPARHPHNRRPLPPPCFFRVRGQSLGPIFALQKRSQVPPPCSPSKAPTVAHYLTCATAVRFLLHVPRP